MALFKEVLRVFYTLSSNAVLFRETGRGIMNEKRNKSYAWILLEAVILKVGVGTHVWSRICKFGVFRASSEINLNAKNIKHKAYGF